MIQDEFTTGVENYKEFFYTLVGLAGEGQNFDGNGMYVRFQTGGGSQTLSLGSATASSGQLFGNNVAVPLGNRPAWPGKRPPYKPNAPCYKQTRPNLNGPAAAKTLPTGTAAAAAAKNALPLLRKKLRPFGSQGRGEVRLAIRKHLKDFIAIIVLLIVALIVGARDPLPPAPRAAGGRAAARQGLRPSSTPSSPPPRPSRRARGRPSTSPASRSARSPASSSRTARPSSGWTSSATTRGSTATRPCCCGPRPA